MVYTRQDFVAEVRRNGAGNQVKPHSYFKSTACPGGYLRSVASQLDNGGTGAQGASVRPSPAVPSTSAARSRP